MCTSRHPEVQRPNRATGPGEKLESLNGHFRAYGLKLEVFRGKNVDASLALPADERCLVALMLRLCHGP